MSRRPAYKSRLSDYQRPLWLDLARWLVNLPRYIRILMTFVSALAVTFAISPLVDYLYLSYMYTDESRILPSLVSSGIGVGMFILGWWLLVGTVGGTPPVRRGVVWYGIVGGFAVIWVIGMAMFGLTAASAPL
jgi:hypothetical protein